MSDKDQSYTGWLLNRFRFAGRGLMSYLKGDRTAGMHVLAAIAAITLGFYFRISMVEWILIVICISAVIAMEIFNSAIETLADRVSSEHDPAIGRTKDLAAASVLVVSIGALITGLIIFLPYILNF